MKSCSILSGMVCRQATPLPLSVGTGAQFFVAGNKMSTSRTHAKAYVLRVNGTVVKSMGLAARWVWSMVKTTGLGTAGGEASWLLH